MEFDPKIIEEIKKQFDDQKKKEKDFWDPEKYPQLLKSYREEKKLKEKLKKNKTQKKITIKNRDVVTDIYKLICLDKQLERRMKIPYEEYIKQNDFEKHHKTINEHSIIDKINKKTVKIEFICNSKNNQNSVLNLERKNLQQNDEELIKDNEDKILKFYSEISNKRTSRLVELENFGVKKVEKNKFFEIKYLIQPKIILE